MKYLAINIGPIGQTLSMSRKPREFWAASYLFSYLMQNILKTIDEKAKSLSLISPYYDKDNTISKIGVGLYPDRAFYEMNEAIDINPVLQEALTNFACEVNIRVQTAQRYFRVMSVQEDFPSQEEAIAGLNKILDWMELSPNACQPDDYDEILNYLKRTTNEQPSPLFHIALNKDYFPIDTLEAIALAGNQKARYSYHRYVCIVQADGDNMGSVVKLMAQKGILNGFSEILMDFGRKSCDRISEFGGQPIYAGGDDLLFIAPIVGRGSNGTILDLIRDLDSYFRTIQNYVKEKLKDVPDVKETSMSYGLSVIYYKYPLYEGWKIAASQLFGKAKNKEKIKGKNAIALNIRKNSGSDFQLIMSKKAIEYDKLNEMILFTPKETLVSAIAHKIRANEALLSTFSKQPPFDGFDIRLKAFYDHVVDLEAKTEEEIKYARLTQEMFSLIYRSRFSMTEETNSTTDKKETDEDKINQIISQFYSTLRVAKFIKGEEVKDE